MIERDFITQKTKEFYIKRYIEEKLNKVGISQIRLKKIPLGEKIIIDTSRPSLVVGSKGANIKLLTKELKKIFNLENPQIEINEVKNVFLNPNVVAEQIASSLERYGTNRFKGIGHKVMANVINAGALGVELIISGKIPGARAKSWRFYQGYLKKCGDVSVSGVRKAKKSALLKSGIIGIKVSIMPSDLILPDNIDILPEPEQIIEEITPKKMAKKKAEPKKRTGRKKAAAVTARKEEGKVKDKAAAGKVAKTTIKKELQKENISLTEKNSSTDKKAEDMVKESAEEEKREEKEEKVEIRVNSAEQGQIVEEIAPKKMAEKESPLPLCGGKN